MVLTWRMRLTRGRYGDEIESYHSDGILTHLKKAFSRDQEEKIYAQHRILEVGPPQSSAALDTPPPCAALS